MDEVHRHFFAGDTYYLFKIYQFLTKKSGIKFRPTDRYLSSSHFVFATLDTAFQVRKYCANGNLLGVSTSDVTKAGLC